MLHPTEKHKMLTGQLYYANDDMLRSERRQTRKILKEYNDSGPDEIEKRQAILKTLLGTLGNNIEIEPPFRCDYGYNIDIGENFYANFNCVILDCTKVIIGNNVYLGPAVQLYTATHPLDAQTRNKGLEMARPIEIEDDVWIGGGVIINPGIRIGRGTTIGSGSVVTKDIPPNVLAVGNPCRVIRTIE